MNRAFDAQTHFLSVLGYEFRDTERLSRALTHRSYSEKTGSDYERLEFLGDAVLDLAVGHLLLDAYKEAKEGELSKMRAALVNAQSLAEIARSIGLGPFIQLSPGEISSGGAEKTSILADVVEAVIGAIYREAGYETAFGVVQKLFKERVQTVNPCDPKTELQEILHAAGLPAPIYHLEGVEGPDHSPVFLFAVEVEGRIVGRGRGSSKKTSQQQAAEEALMTYRK